MQLNEDQILTLAPDEASKKAGKDLANAVKWVTKAANEKAIWGECTGSGSKPYQTQIDANNIAFKCSCPSRKFPCKHGIGLLLLYARQKNIFIETDAPLWVSDWLSKRVEKEEKKQTQEEKPVDGVAQAKRLQLRHEKVIAGMEELLLWLKDIVRNGILDMPEKGFSFFDKMAKRLIDAQAPGLANMVRNLGDINFFVEGWQSDFIAQLINIYMTLVGYKNLSLQPESLQQDIKSLIGYTQNQEVLKEEKGTTDTWLVLAKQTHEVESIATEKNWLYGIETNKHALVLQFIVRGQGSEFSFTPGMYVQAELVFYPSSTPLRALVKRQISTSAVHSINGYKNWQKVVENETERSSILPIKTDMPYIIEKLKPVQYNNQWWLQDESMYMMQLKETQKTLWKLLAMSGGESMTMVVIGKDEAYEPVAIWQKNEYVVL